MSSPYRAFVERNGMDYKRHQEECVNWCIRKELGQRPSTMAPNPTPTPTTTTTSTPTPTPTPSLGGGTLTPTPNPSLGGGTPTRRGALIADEMGLGKTIQIAALIHSNPLPATLIVVPVALMEQWHNILTKIQTPNQTIVNYHGTTRNKQSTKDALALAPSHNHAHQEPNYTQQLIVLTTYGEISRTNRHPQPQQHHPNHPHPHPHPNRPNHNPLFASPLHTIKWSRVVYDEAHHLRNPRTYTHKAALELRSPRTIKWLLTGTPIQNSRRDFYALCEIIGIPSSLYAGPTMDLRTLTREYIIKRTKQQLQIPMPELTEHVIQVPWVDSNERELARQLHTRIGMTKKKQRQQHIDENRIRIPEFTTKLVDYLRARQLCVCPTLTKAAFEDAVANGGYAEEDEDIADTSEIRGFLDDATNGHSKLDAIVRHASTGGTKARKKLIFCEFRMEMDYLEKALSKNGLVVGRIDGRTPEKIKSAYLESQFINVLLLQIRTCNEGLNLQQYSDIYIVSPQWNPAVEAQAVGRAYRIGQTKAVNVYRFVMEHEDIGLDENMETTIIKRQIGKAEEASFIWQQA